MVKRNGQGALVLGALLGLLFLGRRRVEAPVLPPELPPPIPLPYAVLPPAVEVPELPGIAPPEVPAVPDIPLPWTPPEGYEYVEGEGWVRKDIARSAETPAVPLPVIPVPEIPQTGIETPGIPTSTAVDAPGTALPPPGHDYVPGVGWVPWDVLEQMRREAAGY